MGDKITPQQRHDILVKSRLEELELAAKSLNECENCIHSSKSPMTVLRIIPTLCRNPAYGLVKCSEANPDDQCVGYEGIPNVR